MSGDEINLETTVEQNMNKSLENFDLINNLLAKNKFEKEQN